LEYYLSNNTSAQNKTSAMNSAVKKQENERKETLRTKRHNYIPVHAKPLVSPLGGHSGPANNLASGQPSLEVARHPQHLSASSLPLITADANADGERLSTNPTLLLVAFCHASFRVLWKIPRP
jgi:hypothetical protein